MTPEGQPSEQRKRPRLVVKFAMGGDMSTAKLESRAAEIARALPEGEVVRVSPHGRAVLTVAIDADVDAAVRKAAHEPDVDYAEPDVADHAA